MTGKIIWTLVSALLITLTVIFCSVFLFRIHLPYNEEGRFFDEESGTVYLEQSKWVYATLTLSLFALSGFVFYKTIKKFR